MTTAFLGEMVCHVAGEGDRVGNLGNSKLSQEQSKQQWDKEDSSTVVRGLMMSFNVSYIRLSFLPSQLPGWYTRLFSSSLQ